MFQDHVCLQGIFPGRKKGPVKHGIGLQSFLRSLTLHMTYLNWSLAAKWLENDLGNGLLMFTDYCTCFNRRNRPGDCMPCLSTATTASMGMEDVVSSNPVLVVHSMSKDLKGCRDPCLRGLASYTKGIARKQCKAI